MRQTASITASLDSSGMAAAHLSQKSPNSGRSMAFSDSGVAASTLTYSCVTGFNCAGVWNEGVVRRCIDSQVIIFMSDRKPKHQNITARFQKPPQGADLSIKVSHAHLLNPVGELRIGDQEGGDVARVQLIHQRIDFRVHDWLTDLHMKYMWYT